MVRRLTAKRTPAWKALLAIFIAGGGLLWHLLACIESPMAYSPDGKQIAFVTMEPYDFDDSPIRRTHAYRLFVVSNEDKLRLLDESTDYMLTAPGFTPDGKRICYLRIPLLSPEDVKRIERSVRQREEFDRATNRPAGEPWPAGPGADVKRPKSRPTTGEADQTLPFVTGTVEFTRAVRDGPVVPSELVIRDIQTKQIVSRTRIDLRLVHEMGEDLEASLLFAYLLTRTRVASDGRVLVCARNIVLTLDMSTGAQSVLAAPAISSAVSPDGKTLAVAQTRAIGFIQVDGSKAVYVRYENDPSFSGLAWADKRTLAVLRKSAGDKKLGEKAVLDFIATDGRILRSRELDLPGQGEKSFEGELAISPDGRYMAISFGHQVYFMRRDGKVLKSWSDENDLMFQPTFSPDSKRVAFKFMSAYQKRAAAIVFFTPQGKRTSVVPIPRIAAGTTRPASMPSTGPGED